MDTNLTATTNLTPFPVLDIDQIMRHCRILANGDPQAIFTFQTFDDRKVKGKIKNKDKDLTSIFHCQLSRLEPLLKTNVDPRVQRGAGLFVMVNQGDRQGRKTKNVTKVRAVFLDLDENGEAALQKLRDCPEIPNPHLIIETSPSRYHVYWLVYDMELDDFKPVQKELIRRFGGDKNVSDLSRVLRLAGSIHQKGEPHLVNICFENSIPQYPAKIFTDLLTGIIEPKALKSTEPSTASTAELAFDNFMGEVKAKKIPVTQLELMLQYIDRADEYDRWVKIGMALYPLGDDGLDLWLEWSSQANNYDEDACRSRWHTFAKYSDKKVTMGTIYYLAREGGWVPSGGGEPLTDAGNAQRIVRLFGHRIRYCP
ncbi:MAG: PriCT-2 domain-containing protein, partial [Deltaproteobacteria bacterium]|nr:PriCT-2 domain-containing protein [Deltaproteobacteria bacterium]